MRVTSRRTAAPEDRRATGPRDLPGTLAHSIGGLLVLVVVTVLSTYKPRGLTRYGRRKQRTERGRRREEPSAAMP